MPFWFQKLSELTYQCNPAILLLCLEEILGVFKERLDSFVTKYFGTDEKTSSRVADFDSLLQ